MKTPLKKLCIYHGQLGYEGKCAVQLVDVNQPAPILPEVWELVKEVYVINSLIRPIGTNMKLFELTRKDAFPNDVSDIFIVLDPFTHPPGENKTFFLSYNFPVQKTIPIYIFRDLSDNSVFLSLTKETPYENLVKDYYQEFWALPSPVNGWECVEGVVMPKEGGGSLTTNLINCPTRTFSVVERSSSVKTYWMLVVAFLTVIAFYLK